jgi:hypothetical protein
MKRCAPAIFIAAIFTALFTLDLINKNYKDIGFHIAGGIFSVIGLYTACEVGGEELAWVLVAIPFVFLLIGLGLIWIDAQKDASMVNREAPPPQMESMPCPCPLCEMCPCGCESSCDPYVPPPPPPPKPIGPPSPPFGCPKKA